MKRMNMIRCQRHKMFIGKIDGSRSSTPSGANVFDPNIFYKHANPMGLSNFTSIRYGPDSGKQKNK